MPNEKLDDERLIRRIVEQAISRINQGDLSAIDDFWDESADYRGPDGTLTKGRGQIKALFAQLMERGFGQETARIEHIRLLTPEFATVDGSWIVTGARDADGNELPPIKGRGFEVVQKKNGRWKFIATRETIIR